MMRLLTTLTALSIAMLSIGCVRTSHKLSEVGETVTDDEIVGVWEEQDPVFGPQKSARFCIEACSDGTYLRRSLATGCDDQIPFRLAKIADATYVEVDLLDTLSQSEKEAGAAEMQSLEKQPRMLFPIRWERRGEWMALWEADTSVIERLIEEGKLKGNSDGPWPFSTTVSSTAEELRSCLEKHGDEIYAAAMNDSRGHLRRIHRRIADQVPATTPETTRTP